MKIETLVKRFEKHGYERMGSYYNMCDEIEIQNIIKWLYLKHNVFVSVHYCDMNFKTMNPNPYQKFRGMHRYQCGTNYSTQFFTEKDFKTPYEAYFQAIIDISKTLNYLT